MPVSITAGNILELVLKGNWNNQVETNNVFHYVVASLGSGAGSPATQDEFAAGFVVSVLPQITPLTTSLLVYTSLEARELDIDTGELVNGETFLIPTAMGTGESSAEALPPFVTWTYKYLRPSSNFRHGFKRFSGINESQQAGGVPTAAVATALNLLADSLADVLPAWTIANGEPDTAITNAGATPCVLQRMLNGDPLDPINVGLVTSVVFSKIGTQNTRKFGVGV